MHKHRLLLKVNNILQDAIRAILADKAVVVSEYNIVIRGVSCELKLPSVIALKQYHKNPINTPTITRQKVFLRDNYRCQVKFCSFCFRVMHVLHGIITFDIAMILNLPIASVLPVRISGGISVAGSCFPSISRRQNGVDEYRNCLQGMQLQKR